MKQYETSSTLEQLISLGVIPPFVYCYPTRSAHRALDNSVDVKDIWLRDQQNSPTNDLNLYIHVPFCRYKCGFCNLYTVTSNDTALYDRYVDTLCSEIEIYKGVIQSRNLRTIYIGGGTPSLLSERHFERILAKIETIYPAWRLSTEEVALELSPDSVAENTSIVSALKDLGFTRFNLGIQSLDPAELAAAGRSKADYRSILQAIEAVKDAEIPNLSTDLIMGFQSQTDQSWLHSLNELIRLAPETISTYYLTIRPDAWFAGTGAYTYFRNPALYRRYDLAREILLAAGYTQETNVRYKRSGRGGYRQKVLQFRGVPVLGLGAGARTYTNTIDYVNSDAGGRDTQQLAWYMDKVERGEPFLIESGFAYTDEERIRKRIVLDLFDLDLKELLRYDNGKLEEICGDLFSAAIAQGLLSKTGLTRYQLTSTGLKYRDILSWLSFSKLVVERDQEFYHSLHMQNLKARQHLGDLVQTSGLSSANAGSL